MAIDVKHLAHIQYQICNGIKAETRDAILAKYSISDQLNATGSTLTSIKSDIATMVQEGKDKQAAVNAATTFDELNAVVPHKDS